MSNVVRFESCGATLEGRIHNPDGTPHIKALVTILTGDSPNGLKSKTWPPMIAALTARQFTVFAFDFLSQGYSGGERTSLSLSVGCQNLIDSQIALAKHLSLASYRTGFLGSSFGGTVILSTHDRVSGHAIALKSPASFLPEAYESEHGFPVAMEAWRKNGVSTITGLHYRAYLDALAHNVYTSAMNIYVPVLIVHGDADSIVPVGQSRRLCHILGSQARLIELAGANHDYKQPGAQEAMQSHIVQFFAEKLLSES
jgi:pimeloyl-ACP methyl ester carboxylesterase